jgi:DNA-binding transcriptional LysR family regulator
MELRQLQYFAGVAREGTYAAAATALAIAQPAVWRQVRDLEAELGVPLFERAGRRVRLTTDGRLLLDHVTAIIAAADRLKGAASDLRSARAGVVAIACASPHLRRFLAPVMGAFRATHPDVEFRLREYGGGSTPGRGIPDDLLDGIVDLATGVAPLGERRFVGFPIYDVHLVAAVPDEHPWRDVGVIEVSMLEGQPIVASQHGSYSRRALQTACLKAGFEPFVAFDSASPVSVLAMGAAGLGVPITIDDAVPEPADRPWPRLAHRARAIGDSVSLAWRAGAALAPTPQAFVDLAREFVDQRQRSTSA